MKVAFIAGILAAGLAAQTQTPAGGSIEGTAVNAATGAPLTQATVEGRSVLAVVAPAVLLLEQALADADGAGGDLDRQ